MGTKLSVSYCSGPAPAIPAVEEGDRGFDLSSARPGRRRRVARSAGFFTPLLLAIAVLATPAAVGAQYGGSGTYPSGGGKPGYRKSTPDNYYNQARPAPKQQLGGYPSTRYVPRGPAKANAGWSDKAPDSADSTETQSAPTVKIVGVTDGDTITVLRPDKSQAKVRLYGIDAPESDQAFGRKAKQFVSDTCFGENVNLEVFEMDGDGRQVANVTLSDGRILNHELVRAGMAHWYAQSAPEDQALQALQEEARAARRGLWSEPNPVAPWEFGKHGGRSATNVQPGTADQKPVK